MSETEKKKALEIIGQEIEKATEAEINSKKELDRIEDELNKLIKIKEKERDYLETNHWDLGNTFLEPLESFLRKYL